VTPTQHKRNQLALWQRLSQSPGLSSGARRGEHVDIEQKSCRNVRQLSYIGDVVTEKPSRRNKSSSDPFSDLQSPALPPGTTQRTLAVILGGGAGTRLFPLTKDRSKPAVPLGGKYRLVDIPISNCLNSGLRSIYILTQFNSMSLHRHIQASYKFDNFSRSFVDILAAQQTPEGSQWYQGTADAVRQNMRYFLEGPYEHYIILSGDQLYRMDFRALLHQHIRSGAEITLAIKPVARAQASEFGIMQTDVQRRIIRFVEKPTDDSVLNELKIPRELLSSIGYGEEEEFFQASMGIYVFNREVLVECLKNELADFGKHVIPQSIQDRRVHAYIFKGYWEDIGTIRAFYDANLELTKSATQYSFFEAQAPIYTHPRFLPGSKIDGATLREAIVADGCMISGAHIERSVIGVRSIIQSGATIRNSIVMGADYFEADAGSISRGQPAMGIGRNCVIDRAIVDKNARIADGVVITPEGKPPDLDAGNYFIRDGIVVVPKNAVIPAGFWI
jgi:glucose-1-phosphate adenylyltransferase